MNYLVIFLGGGIGSLCRFAISSLVGNHVASSFPWSTLSVNLIGAFLIGVIIEFSAIKFSGSLNLNYLLVTGFLGGFTTFSAFSLESASMWIRGDYTAFACYIGLSVFGTILLVLAAMHLVRIIL